MVSKLINDDVSKFNDKTLKRARKKLEALSRGELKASRYTCTKKGTMYIINLCSSYLMCSSDCMQWRIITRQDYDKHVRWQ